MSIILFDYDFNNIEKASQLEKPIGVCASKWSLS